MTAAERIREYYKEHPEASYDEVSEALQVKNNIIRANVAKDIKAKRCVRMEDGSLDYSSHFAKTEAVEELVEWKNGNRREWIEILNDLARKETNTDVVRMLIKDANRIMKEVTE